MSRVAKFSNFWLKDIIFTESSGVRKPDTQTRSMVSHFIWVKLSDQWGMQYLTNSGSLSGDLLTNLFQCYIYKFTETQPKKPMSPLKDHQDGGGLKKKLPGLSMAIIATMHWWRIFACGARKCVSVVAAWCFLGRPPGVVLIENISLRDGGRSSYVYTERFRVI